MTQTKKERERQSVYRKKIIPLNEAHRRIITCDSLSSVFVSCMDKLFGDEFGDAKRRNDETNDHTLLPASLFVRLVERFECPILDDIISSTRRAVTRFFDTFGVKI